MNKFNYLAAFVAPLAAAACTQTTVIEQVEPAPAKPPAEDAGAEAGQSGGQRVEGPTGTLFGATVSSYATLDPAGKVLTAGVVIPYASFTAAPANAPFQDDLVLAMPEAVEKQTFMHHLRVNWLSGGHGPSPYSAPHFDLHFYRGTVAEIDAINCRADQRLPPAEQVPPEYTLEPQLCASRMGFHAWPKADLGASSWSGSMILGYFAQKMVFLEPMIPKSTLIGKQSFSLDVAKPQTAGGAKTLYPRKLTATYDAAKDAYTFEMSAFESID